MPVCLVIARALGFGQYWWAVVGGLIVIALLIAAFDAFVKKGDKARGGAFEKDLARDAQGGAGASKQEVREAVKELSQKWTESLAQLKGTGLQIYSLPWYLLIGEPQSGKSTTLKNSGLEFPVGGDGLSGSGGHAKLRLVVRERGGHPRHGRAGSRSRKRRPPTRRSGRPS